MLSTRHFLFFLLALFSLTQTLRAEERWLIKENSLPIPAGISEEQFFSMTRSAGFVLETTPCDLPIVGAEEASQEPFSITQELWRGKRIKVLLSNNQNLLLTPVRPVTSLQALEEEEVIELRTTAVKLSHLFQRLFGTADYFEWTPIGSEQGQQSSQLYVEILPAESPQACDLLGKIQRFCYLLSNAQYGSMRLLPEQAAKIKALAPLSLDEAPPSEQPEAADCKISHRLEAAQYAIRTLLTMLQRRGEAFYIEGQIADIKENSLEPRTFPACAFCKPEVIQRQIVFPGKDLSVLYNHLPFVPQKHFMIVSNRHAANRGELHKEELLEEHRLLVFMGQSLEEHFGEQGYKIWVQHGLLAGQTVPHHHTHIISNRTEEMLFWLCRVLCDLYSQKRTPASAAQYDDIRDWLTELSIANEESLLCVNE